MSGTDECGGAYQRLLLFHISPAPQSPFLLLPLPRFAIIRVSLQLDVVLSFSSKIFSFLLCVSVSLPVSLYASFSGFASPAHRLHVLEKESAEFLFPRLFPPVFFHFLSRLFTHVGTTIGIIMGK